MLGLDSALVLTVHSQVAALRRGLLTKVGCRPPVLVARSAAAAAALLLLGMMACLSCMVAGVAQPLDPLVGAGGSWLAAARWCGLMDWRPAGSGLTRVATADRLWLSGENMQTSLVLLCLC